MRLAVFLDTPGIHMPCRKKAEIEDREDGGLIINEREDYNGKTQNPLAGPA
jgi:hypothetical protein